MNCAAGLGNCNRILLCRFKPLICSLYDFGMLAHDFGLGQRRKSNPMKSAMSERRFINDHRSCNKFLFKDMFRGPPNYSSTSKLNPNNSSKQYSTRDFKYDGLGQCGKSNLMISGMSDRRFTNDQRSRNEFLFKDMFDGPPKYSSTSKLKPNNSRKQYSTSDFNYDSMFKPLAPLDEPTNNGSSTKPSSLPASKPVYDEDLSDRLPGLKKTKSAVATTLRSDSDVFASNSLTDEDIALCKELRFLMFLTENIKSGWLIIERPSIKSRSSSRSDAGNRSTKEDEEFDSFVKFVQEYILRQPVISIKHKGNTVDDLQLNHSSKWARDMECEREHKGKTFFKNDRSKLAKSRSARADLDCVTHDEVSSNRDKRGYIIYKRFTQGKVNKP